MPMPRARKSVEPPGGKGTRIRIGFSGNAALTSSGILFEYKYGDEGFSYGINCVFEKTKSWGKVKTAYILAHEQVHFDISEWHARKLNKALREYRFNERTVSRDIPAIYDHVMKEQTYFQTLYDSETNHSRDKEQQAFWQEKIKKELEKLKFYANYYRRDV